MDDEDYDIATLYNNIGNCFARSGEHIKAIHCYKKSLKQYPKNSVAYNNLRNCYVALGKFKESKQLYERPVQINCNKFTSNSNELILINAIVEKEDKNINKDLKTLRIYNDTDLLKEHTDSDCGTFDCMGKNDDFCCIIS